MLNKSNTFHLNASIIQTVVNTLEYNYYISENTYIYKTSVSFGDSIFVSKHDLSFISKKHDIINSNEIGKCVMHEQGLLINFKSVKLILFEGKEKILVKEAFSTREPNIFGSADFEFEHKNNLWSIQKWQSFSTSIGN